MTGSADSQKQSKSQQRHWLSAPEPIRRVFDSFPLVTKSENTLPQRARKDRANHILYIFSTSQSTSYRNLSCNPTCLRWQTYLLVKGIRFSVRASNNHASPSGSLPFLLPKRTVHPQPPTPIAANKIQKWTTTQVEASEPNDRLEIYQALIDQNVRNAWLYYLYLDRSNFDAVAASLYIHPSTSNTLVQSALAIQLRSAAQEELLKGLQKIDHDEIYDAADEAFSSLTTILGSDGFFSKGDVPDLFDASLFAYTHLLLDESLQWRDLTLSNILRKYPALLDHRERILQIIKQD